MKSLGAQRISPQPLTSTIGDDGITYTFPATAAPMSVQIELMPSFPGIHSFEMRVPGSADPSEKSCWSPLQAVAGSRLGGGA